jgi:hypothetical protein
MDAWKMACDPINDWIDKAVEADTVEFDIDEFNEPSGPPLSPEEIEAARVSLTRWQDPGAFKVEVDALCRRCASNDWFNRPQLKFLHDAFVLSRFAVQSRVNEVRLAQASAQWPDGFVRIVGKTHNIEVTSTHGDRPLGKEYRAIKGPTLDPVENWVARADSIPHFLDAAVSKKTKKNYSAPCWLVVYLNISEYGIRQRETEATIAQVKACYASAFEAVSVLWKGRLY